MIERTFIKQNKKEFQIKEFIGREFKRAGLSDVKLVRTPLGEKIIVSASRPGLVVGRMGSNITKLTKDLKSQFGLENPQIELDEVTNPPLDVNIIAEAISSSLERFGSARFKGIGHRAMTDAMRAGAMGIEILISGKIPSSRAKTWRFYQGYLKKCGDVAIEGVKTAYSSANLKTGVVGIQVRLMPPDLVLPDRVEISKEIITEVEEKEEPAKPKKKKSTKKTTKKTAKKEEKKEAKEEKKAEEKQVEKVEEKTETKENSTEEVKENSEDK